MESSCERAESTAFMRSASVGLVVAWVALLAVPSLPAFAHAETTGYSVEDLSVLDLPPAEVSVSFDSPVTVPDSSAVLQRTDGRLERLGHTLERDGRLLRIELPVVGEGWFKVSWSAFAEDGHAADGYVRFAVGGGAGGDAVPEFSAPSLLATRPSPGSVLDAEDPEVVFLFEASPPDAVLEVFVVSDEAGLVAELELRSETGEFAARLPRLDEGDYRVGWLMYSGGVVAAEGSFRVSAEQVSSGEVADGGQGDGMVAVPYTPQEGSGVEAQRSAFGIMAGVGVLAVAFVGFFLWGRSRRPAA